MCFKFNYEFDFKFFLRLKLIKNRLLVSLFQFLIIFSQCSQNIISLQCKRNFCFLLSVKHTFQMLYCHFGVYLQEIIIQNKQKFEKFCLNSNKWPYYESKI